MNTNAQTLTQTTYNKVAGKLKTGQNFENLHKYWLIDIINWYTKAYVSYEYIKVLDTRGKYS